MDATGHTDRPVLETLNFISTSASQPCESNQVASEGHLKETCLLCELQFDVDEDLEGFLRHLVMIHKFVIGDVKLVADLKKYIAYWRERLKLKPVSEFCTSIQTNSKGTDVAPKEDYHLLCDILPEDKLIREKLQKLKLEEVLSKQQDERQDLRFSRGCLFCRDVLTGNRSHLLDHMMKEHGFNIGQPDNIVYVNEFLDLLQEKLNNLQCLYCERTFKDRHVLKEHMRKKQHKKINPKNRTYDKFYIINYLELGKSWQNLSEENDQDLLQQSSDEESWEDWQEKTGAEVVCLFCDWSVATSDGLLQHMKEIHRFNLEKMRQDLGLSFYQQVKLINFIRRQVHQHTCAFCLASFSSAEELQGHMTSHCDKMTSLPDLSVWDQPEYYFPTYEDDSLLCTLQEPEEENDNYHGNDMVIAEDSIVMDSILKEKSVLQDLLK